MKKRLLCTLLALITVFSLCISAYAATPETISPMFNSTVSCTPKIVFIGSQALCKLQIFAKQADASIRASVRLLDDNGDTVTMWSLTGTGSLNWQDYYSVPSGTYTLSVSVHVYHPDTGSDYISKSYSATLN